jgi:hypothetical protein
MSALVWSVESAILGLWALVFSFYSTPFHAFIARSHAMIAGFTMVLQLISTARGLDIGHAVSEAFVCAVTALLLVYVASILDTANHTRLFSMPYAGMLPLDAVFGVAWFCAAMVSATGMALSEVGQRLSLMFHQYGYHVSVMLPSFLILWLYNYDANNTNEPIHKGIKLVRNNNVTITHALIFTVYACVWGWFVVAQFFGEGFLTFGKQWPAWQDMSVGTSVTYVAAVMLKFLGRGGCVLVPVSAAFSARTSAQTIMAWTLVGVAAAYAIDLLSNIERIFGITSPGNQPSEPLEYPSSIIESNMSTVPDIPHLVRHDPAAVIMPNEAHAMPLFTQPRLHQWRRDKMV